MKIYKNKAFHLWAKFEKLPDVSLKDAIEEINNGIFEANLGGHVYKKRIAIRGKGKRGSLRTILAYKINDKAFFVYGYAKNKKSNVSDKEKDALKKLAKLYFNYNEQEIEKAVQQKELFEVTS